MITPFWLPKPVHTESTAVQSVVNFIDANSYCMGAITLLREKEYLLQLQNEIDDDFYPFDKMRKRDILFEGKFTKDIFELSNGFSFSDDERDYIFSRLKKMERQGTKR